MLIIDVVFLIILSGFVFYGLFFGLIRTIGVLVGLLIGTWVAGNYYLEVFGFIKGAFLGFDNLGKILSFLIVFSLTEKLVGLGFSIIDKTFNILSIIPFLKTINKLGGVIFGLIEGTLTIGLFLFIASRYIFIETWLGALLQNSVLAPFFLNTVKVLMPLLPDVLKQLQPFLWYKQ